MNKSMETGFTGSEEQYINPIHLLESAGGTLHPDEVLVLFRKLHPAVDYVRLKILIRQYLRDRTAVLSERSIGSVALIRKEIENAAAVFRKEFKMQLSQNEVERMLDDAAA